MPEDQEMDSAAASLFFANCWEEEVLVFRKSQFFQLTERIHISHTIAAAPHLIWP